MRGYLQAYSPIRRNRNYPSSYPGTSLYMATVYLDAMSSTHLLIIAASICLV